MTNAISQIKSLFQQVNIKPATGYHRLLTYIEETELQDFSLSSLSSYPESANLCHILHGLPPDLIAQELGLDALIWTWTNISPNLKNQCFTDAVARLTKLDSKVLEKVKGYFETYFKPSASPLAIFKAYKLITSSVDIYNKELLPFLIQFCKKEGVTISPERIGRYKLEAIFPKGAACGWAESWDRQKSSDGKKSYEIYLDLPFGICLMYQEKANKQFEPNAIVSFMPMRMNTDTVFVKQIQGVEGFKIIDGEVSQERSHARGLVVIDWEKLLVLLAEIISEELEYKEIAIQGVKNNSWSYQKYDRLEQRYDKTAEKLGYKLRDDNNWYKILNRRRFWQRNFSK